MTGPWSGWLNAGDPNAGQGAAYGGFPQYGQLGLLPPAQQGYAPLTARQPSVLDRVLGRLFPAGQYAGLLDAGSQRDLQRQGLLSLGAHLLQAGGPQAYQGGTLANLGGALQQSQVNFPQMAEQALRLQAYKAQAAQQQHRQQMLESLPGPGGDVKGWIEQIMPQFLGDPETLKALGELHKSLGDTGPNLQSVEGTDYRPGSPTFGKNGHWLLAPGTNKRVDFIPLEAPSKPLVEPGALWSDVKARLAKWEPIDQAIGQYQQFRNAPLSPASSSALLAASQALTNVRGGYPEESAGLEKLPEFGKLFKMLQALGGSQNLTPAQRADLVSTTDAVVRRLQRNKTQARTDAERQLRRAGFSAEDLQTFLPGTPAAGGNILDQP